MLKILKRPYQKNFGLISQKKNAFVLSHIRFHKKNEGNGFKSAFFYQTQVCFLAFGGKMSEKAFSPKNILNIRLFLICYLLKHDLLNQFSQILSSQGNTLQHCEWLMG